MELEKRRYRSKRFIPGLAALALLATLSACGDSANVASSTTGSTSGASTSAPKPTVSFQSNPTSVALGQSTVLDWNSSNAQTCTASGGWSGSQALSGMLSTSPLTATTSFTLTCTGSGGSTAQSVSVTVADAAPTVTLTASPATLSSGSAAVLTWSSTNATACSASGAWTGSENLSGSESTGPLKASSTYTLTCTGVGGSSAQTVTVAVTTAANNGTASLSWTAPTEDTDGGPLTALNGYTVYYGTSPSALTQSAIVGGATTTSYTVTGLAAGTWYFAVAADALDGTQSALSNIASKTL